MTTPTSEYMSPKEAAAAFGVTTKTIVKWDNAGKLKSHRTLGNHRRFLRSDIAALVAGPAGD